MGSELFNKIYYGKEDVARKGAAVPPTNIFIGQMPVIKPDRKPTFPAENFGLRGSSYRAVIHQYLYQNTLSTEHGAFQHLPLLGGGGLKGAVAAAEQTGGQGDYLWSFSPSATAIDDVDSFSLRMGDDNQAWLSEYCEFERIRISGTVAQGQDASPVKLEADFFSRQLRETTFATQAETATVVGTITEPGNAEVIVTAAGMTGTPLTLSVAVADNDTASQVAEKIRVALEANTAVTALFSVTGTGANVTLTKLITSSVDATLNIAVDNDTCVGLTPDATSTDASTGVLTLPTLEPLNAKLARLYLNSSWAAVGTTELANLLRTFDIEILTARHPKFAGAADKTFNSSGGGKVAVMGTFGLEGGSSAVDILATQQAGTFQVARLYIPGSLIGTGVPYSLTVDFGGAFEDAQPISGADRNDNLATFVLHGYMDKTASKALQFSCVTNSNSY